MDQEDNAPIDFDAAIGDAFDSFEAEASTETEELDTNAEVTEEVTEADETISDVENTEETETDDVEEVETVEAIQPPQSMSAKDREAFYALPPEQQQWISERVKQQEADYTKKTMELAEQRKAFDKLEQIIGPRRQQLQMAGMDESTAIGQLFALSDYADRDPVGFVKYLFNQRGLSLDALNQSGGEQAQVTDPRLDAVMQELNSLKQANHQQTFAQQQAQMAEIGTAIEAFAKNPEFPFYSELENDMVPIVQALKAQNPSMSPNDALSKAYKMAMAGNSEVSAKAEADRQAKEQAEAVKKAKAEAAKAKKAQGTTVKGSFTAKPGKNMSIDDAISAAYDAVNS